MKMLKVAIAALFALALHGGDLSSDDMGCLACHGQKGMTKKNASGEVVELFVDKAAFAKSVHASQGCTGCHVDLAGGDHPGKPVEKVACATCHDKAVKSFETSAHAKAIKAGKYAPSCTECHGKHDILPSSDSASPISRKNISKTCATCHDEVVNDVEASVHGKAVAKGIKEAPTCLDCHSDHNIQALKGSSSLAISQDVCSRCHADQRMNAKFDLPGNRVSTFFQSYHGLSSKLGSPRAANCASCHGFHKVLPSSDPASTIHPSNLVRTCGKCHPGANENFTAGRIHTDGTEKTTLGDRVNTFVKSSYILLIILVIGAMAAHNLFALWRKARIAYRDRERTVVRMNTVARIQHGLLALSFIYLALTGFALKYPESWLGAIFGASEAVRRIGHRVAAVIMIALSFYHLFFMAFTKDGRTFVKDMWPERKDFFDIFVNLRYFRSRKNPRPEFKRFGYAEKAEYWALVWGTIIMTATGLMLWAKMWFTHFLPRWMVDVATTVHLYEAILATLAIIVWHFYFVIFDPDIYPLNWAWFDGRVNRHHYKEE
ncbi:MAG: cytochrome b/b6 domain-containing protein, partial [Firmicutes bacterium]|nr:cytochrome b/b6 domain-containing protein [Bacillota bacterium]